MGTPNQSDQPVRTGARGHPRPKTTRAVRWKVATLVATLLFSGLSSGCATPSTTTAIRTKPLPPRVIVLRNRPGYVRSRAVHSGSASRCVRKPHRWVCKSL